MVVVNYTISGRDSCAKYVQESGTNASHLRAATALLHFAGKNTMLDSFDEELFEQTVDRIIIQSRNEFVFELKCGLKLKERM